MKKYIILLIILCTVCSVALSKYHDNKQKLHIIFTVDVEDNRGNIPYLIEGDLSEFDMGVNGVDYIMDTFEKYDSKAVFFVNIYEKGLYPTNYMPLLLKRMNNRGHEVALHAHAPSNHDVEVFKRGLDVSGYDEQLKVYEYGRDYIYDAIGKNPVSYRAGAYRCNNNTFKALYDAGFKIDSSMYYAKAGDNNNISDIEYTNQVFKYDGIIEFPIEAVYNKNGWRKLDLDFLSYEEIIDVIKQVKKDDSYNTIQMMFHSYSFMDLKEGEDKIALIYDGSKVIYGVNDANKNKIEKILEYINNTEDLDVITFEDYLKLELDIPKIIKNKFFYLIDKSLAFMNKDVRINIVRDSILEVENSFDTSKDCMYNFTITSKNKTCTSSGWIKNNKCSLKMPLEADGLYYLKCYMRDNEGKISRAITNDIYVENGEIKEICNHK